MESGRESLVHVALGQPGPSTCTPRGPRLQGRIFKEYLSGEKIYTCSNCRTHVTDHENMISKLFQGRHGRAFLFSDV